MDNHGKVMELEKWQKVIDFQLQRLCEPWLGQLSQIHPNRA